MSDIIDFVRPTPRKAPTNSLKDKFGDDYWLLEFCADWRAHRAQQQKNWAEHDRRSGWGHLEGGETVDTEPLAEMKTIEHTLATVEPGTMLLARQLLGICLTILAHAAEDPEATLAEGPVIEILRNVINSLGYCEGDMPIGERRRQVERRAKLEQTAAAEPQGSPPAP